jgi:glycosyltransferase involved in cell wall biosynthesis
MEAKPIILSLVCPAFNEEEVLPLFHQELSAVLAGLPPEYQVEILYVDDGSRDRTLEVLRGLAARDRRVRFLSFSRNFGHQAALLAGLAAARGDAVVTLDSDLQHPPALIPTLLEHWRAGKDVVVTIRDDRASPRRVERFLSCSFYRIMGWLSDTEIRPAAADFRLLSRHAVDLLLGMDDRQPFLRGMVQWLGLPSAEVHYTPARRGAGHSKYSIRRKLRLALDGLLSFSRTPLHLPLALGLPAVALGLGLTGWAVLRGLFGSTRSFPGLMLGSLYLLGGCLLCVLGVLGEYLGRIYDHVRNRPLYVLKETSGSGPAGRMPPALARPATRDTEGRTPAA